LCVSYYPVIAWIGEVLNGAYQFLHRPCFAALPVHGYVALFLWERELFFGFGCHDGSECAA
jgi:hypothetical protein